MQEDNDLSYPQKEFTINVYEADGVTLALGVSVTAYSLMVEASG